MISLLLSYHKLEPTRDSTRKMLRSPATAPMLRSAVARRAFTSTASARTTHPAHSSSGEQSVGEDMGEVKAKNSMVPVFMAIGAASVG